MVLTDKVALITGGKRIGASVAEGLARRGVDVSLCYRQSIADAEGAAATVRAMGRSATVTQANVACASDCQRLVDATVAELGRLDILINMASTYVRTPFDDLTEADWDRALAVDLKGAYLCSRAAVPHLRAGRGWPYCQFL